MKPCFATQFVFHLLRIFLDHAIGTVEAQFAGLAQVLDAFRLLSSLDKRESPVVISLGHVCIERDGLGEIGNGMFVVVLCQIEIATVVVLVESTSNILERSSMAPALLICVSVAFTELNSLSRAVHTALCHKASGSLGLILRQVFKSSIASSKFCTTE